MDLKQLEPLLFIVAIFVVFYLLLIRPQQKKRREMQEMQTNLAPGTEIVTTAGMYAKIVRVEADDTLLVEVAPGVTCRYMKQAIMRVVPAEQPAVAAPAAAPVTEEPAKDAEAPVAETPAGDAKAGPAATADGTEPATDGTEVKDAPPETTEGSTAVDPAKGERSS